MAAIESHAVRYRIEQLRHGRVREMLVAAADKLPDFGTSDVDRMSDHLVGSFQDIARRIIGVQGPRTTRGPDGAISPTPRAFGCIGRSLVIRWRTR